jgi:hypothetical protein
MFKLPLTILNVGTGSLETQLEELLFNAARTAPQLPSPIEVAKA